MKPKEFIALYFEQKPLALPGEILDLVRYKHNGLIEWGKSGDLNWRLRAGVAKKLLHLFEESDKELIRFLLAEEITFCRKETLMTETLRYLAFMLFSLGDLQDIPILFEAKMNTSFDSRCGLDLELIFGLDKEETKKYYRSNPHKNYDIAGAIEKFEKYEHTPADKFLEYVKEYFVK